MPFNLELINFELMEQARPFFRNLRTFKLNQPIAFFDYFQQDLINLKSLSLHDIGPVSRFCMEKPFRIFNSTELRFIHIDLGCMNNDEFKGLLDGLPNIENIFITESGGGAGVHLETAGNELAKRYPNLRGFGYYYNYYYGVGRFNTYGFEFLKKFKNLTSLELGNGVGSSCTYLAGPILFIPNIKYLSIWHLKCSGQSQEMNIYYLVQTIKRMIRDRRDRFPDNDIVHIVVNEDQYRVLRCWYDEINMPLWVNRNIRLSIVERKTGEYHHFQKTFNSIF